MRKRARRTNPQAGFTLVEILVVITIIGLIMSLIGPRVLGYLSDSKAKTARIQIQGFASALDLYYLDNGRYPTASEGLGALAQKPDSAADLERSLSERQHRAEGPVGPSLRLQLSGTARRLRHRLARPQGAGRRCRTRRQYHQLAVT